MSRSKLIMRCMAMILMLSDYTHCTMVKLKRPILVHYKNGSDPLEISTVMVFMHSTHPMDCIYVSDHELIHHCIIWVDEVHASPIDQPILETLHQALFELVAPEFDPVPASV